MTLFARLDRHADLVDRMSETLGIDMAEEVMRGNIAPEELRAAVLNCVACKDPDGCDAWLDAQTGVAAATPGYCRNKARLEGLAHK